MRAYTAKMARSYNPNGQAERFARCEQTLKEAGGRRINVRLQPRAAKSLDKVMKKNRMSQTDALNYILITLPTAPAQ